jgi:phage FluMu protein Com
MPIEFRCPQCQKLLRVPSESAGAKAKCPQCGAIADIPQSDAEQANDEEGPARSSPSQDANPFTEGTQPLRPASKPAGEESINPYSAPAAGYEPVGFQPSSSGAVVPTPVDAGSVISYAWEVWKLNLGILLGVTVVVFGANMGFSAAQGGVEAVFEQQGEPAVGAAIGGVISLVSMVVQTFLGIGQAQIVLKLLRRQPAEFGELFGGGPLFLPVLGASILAGLAMIAGFIACVIPGILLALFFWPFYWLIVDRKATAIESFGVAQTLAKLNVGTTIVLWLASFGIMLVGVLAFCVGILFAAPLVSLIWGAGYLMMSGQITPKPQY